MSERPFRIRPTLRQEWIRYRQKPARLTEPRLRAGVAGAYLPPVLLPVPHEQQTRVSDSVPACASMVFRYYERPGDVAWLAGHLRTDDYDGTPGLRLGWLRGWGWRVRFPQDLQFFRDGTVELNQRLGTGGARLVYQWEERWLRYLSAALREGVPPILFVDLGRLYPLWRGFEQPHAVVLAGGDGRHAWINDPSRREGPVRVGLCTLMDAMLPGEPLAALLSPGSRVLGSESGGSAP
jgi:hypothetical protein